MHISTRIVHNLFRIKNSFANHFSDTERWIRFFFILTMLNTRKALKGQMEQNTFFSYFNRFHLIFIVNLIRFCSVRSLPLLLHANKCNFNAIQFNHIQLKFFFQVNSGGCEVSKQQFCVFEACRCLESFCSICVRRKNLNNNNKFLLFSGAKNRKIVKTKRDKNNKFHDHGQNDMSSNKISRDNQKLYLELSHWRVYPNWLQFMSNAFKLSFFFLL